MKQCTLCKETLPLTSFDKAPRYKCGHNSRCKVCRYKLKKEYRETHKGRLNERRREVRGSTRWDNIKSKYGITEGDFNNLFESQESRCAICGKTDAVWHVDHCHTTGNVRGILCSGCNTSLGKFGDSLEGLMKAVTYLEKFYG